MLEAARLQRSTPDFADSLADQRRRQQDIDLEQIASLRQGLTLVMVVVSIVIVALGGYTVWRIEQSLRQSINREVRRTEAMIAGMSDAQPITGQLYGCASQMIESSSSSNFPSGVESVRIRRSSKTTSRSA